MSEAMGQDHAPSLRARRPLKRLSRAQALVLGGAVLLASLLFAAQQGAYALKGMDLLQALASWLGSEERRVGKECRPLCRSRWSPYH